jgi:SAM-dependent methyltransferase
MAGAMSDRVHNQAQRAYFEMADKPRMVPVDSAYLRRHVDALVRFGSLVPGERILEVGCGMGRYTLLLAGRGLHADGLDLSPVLLERLREYAGNRFRGALYAADIENPPAEMAGRYDAVIALFALHHMHDLRTAFQSMSHLLKPGGRVVFLEPNAYNPLFYLQILATPGMSWQGDKGIVMMRRRVVFDALHEAGFVRPEMTRFGFLPPFVANRRGGMRVEAVLERVPLWRGLLPFQLFRAARP